MSDSCIYAVFCAPKVLGTRTLWARRSQGGSLNGAGHLPVERMANQDLYDSAATLSIHTEHTWPQLALKTSSCGEHGGPT